MSHLKHRSRLSKRLITHLLFIILCTCNILTKSQINRNHRCLCIPARTFLLKVIMCGIIYCEAKTAAIAKKACNKYIIKANPIYLEIIGSVGIVTLIVFVFSLRVLIKSSSK